MKLKVLFVIIVWFCPFIAQTTAQCIFESPLSATARPKFFGNTTTQTTLITQKSQWIYLDDQDEIIGYCKTSFKNLGYGNRVSEIHIYCENREIYISDYYNSRYNPTSNIFECTSEEIWGTCSILSPPDRAARPKFFKKIGTRTMQISPEAPSIIMKYDQEITARCDTKFKSPNHPSTELNLICLQDKIVVLGHPYSPSYSSFECETIQWNLYESVTPFTWCPSSMASYILARPSISGYEYLAGICYNFEEMSLKSLYYSAKSKFTKLFSPKKLTTFKPSVEISDIDSNFISKKTNMYDNPQIEKWIKFSNFKNESIVQNPRLYNDLFQQFNQLLNIDWWPGLQLGNWQFYEEALAKHIASDGNEYDILAGVANAVAAPIRKESCHKNYTMVELADSENNKIPLYIWNYLKSTKNDSDEVVVIGVNSPFYDYYDEKYILEFCNDICHQIEWLENIHSTFRYRPMGVIFCCSVDEVIASERLEGFAIPKELIPPPSLPLLSYRIPDSTTIESSDTTILDETTERELEYDEYGNLY